MRLIAKQQIGSYAFSWLSMPLAVRTWRFLVSIGMFSLLPDGSCMHRYFVGCIWAQVRLLLCLVSWIDFAQVWSQMLRGWKHLWTVLIYHGGLLEHLLNGSTVKWILSENLNDHFSFLHLNEHVQLAQQGLDLDVSRLVIFEELLHIFQGMAQLGLVNQRQFIKLLEYFLNVSIYLVDVKLNFMIALLD